MPGLTDRGLAAVLQCIKRRRQLQNLELCKSLRFTDDGEYLSDEHVESHVASFGRGLRKILTAPEEFFVCGVYRGVEYFYE